MSTDLYARPRQEGTSRRVRQRLLIDKINNRFVNPELFNLFKFASFGYGDQLNVSNLIDATVTLSIDDNTGQVTVPHGTAEMSGTAGDTGSVSNFNVKANFQNGQLHGDCTFNMTYSDGEFQLDQANFKDGRCVVSLNLSYDYAVLKFNEEVGFWLPTWSPPDVWYEFNEHNTFLNVARLLNLYPDLIDSDWSTKIKQATQLFTDIITEF